MRIVSLNAWCGGMYDQFAPWLPSIDADVVCLQEVTRTPGLDGWTTYRDDERRLPQRADLAADVADLLPNHQTSFVVSDAGPIWHEDPASTAPYRQDFGLLTAVHRRLPVVGQLSTFVKGAFVDHDRWPSAGRPRLAQGVRVLDRDGGRAVSIVHLHGLRDPAGKHDTADRRVQAENLAAMIERLREPNDVTVLCGDLNLLPDSETFTVLAEVGLTDLVGTADTRTSRYTKPTRHANYLLVSDPGVVKHFEVVAEPEVSDHRPLLLEI